MAIIFNHTLNTYVAVSRFGLLEAIYDPAKHGTLDEFRRAYSASNDGDNE